jgi:hypothetical protein
MYFADADTEADTDVEGHGKFDRPMYFADKTDDTEEDTEGHGIMYR